MQGLYHLQASKEREAYMIIEIPDPTPEEQQARMQEKQKAVMQQVMAWQQEADALQEKYPCFNLDSLLADQQARRQLMTGVSMKRVFLAWMADDNLSEVITA